LLLGTPGTSAPRRAGRVEASGADQLEVAASLILYSDFAVTKSISQQSKSEVKFDLTAALRQLQATIGSGNPTIGEGEPATWIAGPH